MAYTKTTWATGDVITADKLNNMEGGIDKATIKFVPLKDGVTPTTLDMTWQEVKDLFDAGYLLCISYIPSFIGYVDVMEGEYAIGYYHPHLDNGHLDTIDYFFANSADDYPVVSGGAG